MEKAIILDRFRIDLSFCHIYSTQGAKPYENTCFFFFVLFQWHFGIKVLNYIHPAKLCGTGRAKHTCFNVFNHFAFTFAVCFHSLTALLMKSHTQRDSERSIVCFSRHKPPTPVTLHCSRGGMNLQPKPCEKLALDCRLKMGHSCAIHIDLRSDYLSLFSFPPTLPQGWRIPLL